MVAAGKPHRPDRLPAVIKLKTEQLPFLDTDRGPPAYSSIPRTLLAAVRKHPALLLEYLMVLNCTKVRQDSHVSMKFIAQP